MHHPIQTTALKSLEVPCVRLSSLTPIYYRNLLHGAFRNRVSADLCCLSMRNSHSYVCCGGGPQLSVRNHRPNSFGSSNGFTVNDDDDGLRTVQGVKNIDVATLGNLCVDIVLNVPQLPPPSCKEHKAYMDDLSKSPPDKQYWEAGGNCNVSIAAARLGLCCVTIGHVGDEIYGKFLSEVLHDEGIRMVGMCGENDDVHGFSDAYETLLCWVLIDSLQRHGFCSRADFSKEPAFSWLSELSAEVKMAIKQSKILIFNGYVFDELSPQLIVSALDYAVEVGTSVFFDPGPRGRTLANGSPDERRALDKLLTMSDVLLPTSEEAESLTGISNPILAGKELLKKGERTKWVIVKTGARGSILVTVSNACFAPAFKVDVVDTVGCGDSFVAAIAFGFIHRLPLVYTLAIANAVGAATAMGYGAGRNVASLEQVVKLLRDSKVNEDDTYLDDLGNESTEIGEITLLSNMNINGNNGLPNHIGLQKVVSEMLPKLEASRVKSAML